MGWAARTLSVDVWKAAGMRLTAGGRWLGRWANGEGRGTVRKAAGTQVDGGIVPYHE